MRCWGYGQFLCWGAMGRTLRPAEGITFIVFGVQYAFQWLCSMDLEGPTFYTHTKQSLGSHPAQCIVERRKLLCYASLLDTHRPIIKYTCLMCQALFQKLQVTCDILLIWPGHQQLCAHCTRIKGGTVRPTFFHDAQSKSVNSNACIPLPSTRVSCPGMSPSAMGGTEVSKSQLGVLCCWKPSAVSPAGGSFSSEPLFVLCWEGWLLLPGSV